MSADNWLTLLQRYRPGDARVCNCRMAYEHQSKQGRWACKWGCSTARIDAANLIADKVVEEFKL